MKFIVFIEDPDVININRQGSVCANLSRGGVSDRIQIFAGWRFHPPEAP